MYKSGQLIKAKVNKFPLIDHYGIILVDRGENYVMHNSPFVSSVIETLDKFLSTRTKIEVKDTDLILDSNESIIDRFEMECKKQYRLFNYNCEHFIDCMLDQPQKSEQIQTWILGLSIAFMSYRLLRR